MLRTTGSTINIATHMLLRYPSTSISSTCCWQRTSNALAMYSLYSSARAGANYSYSPYMQIRRKNSTSVEESTQWEYPIFSSDTIKDRKSVFLAHASVLPTASVLPKFIDHLTSLPQLKRATHCMYAYRIIPDKADPSRWVFGKHDGGERGSGERLLRLIDQLHCENAIVVVSRWYGGVPLGSDRWKRISTVAKEALAAGDFPKKPGLEVSSTPKRRKK